MKLFFSAVSFLFFLSASLFSETHLDMGDIYVWGEDMYVFDGVRTEDIFLYPSLEKAAFLSPYSGDVFEKISPRIHYGPSDGMYLHAGAGNHKTYLLRLAHGVVTDPWQLNWRFTGKGGEVSDRDYFNSRMKGYMNASYRRGSGTADIYFKGISDEETPEREFYNMLLSGSLEAGGINISPKLYYSPGKVSGVRAYQAGGKLSLEKDIAYYNSLRLSGSYTINSISGEEDSFSDFNMRYRSRMFRDFTFNVEAGVRAGSGFEYGAGMSGDIFRTGYRIYFKNIFADYSLFNMTRNTGALVFEEMIKAPEITEAGLAIYRDIPVADYTELKFVSRTVEDSIIYVVNNEGTYTALNYEKSANIFTASAGLKKYPLYLRFKYTDSRPRLPFQASGQLNLGGEKEMQIKPGTLRVSTDLQYADKVNLWYDSYGTNKSSVRPGINLSASATMEIRNGIFFTLGADNLLGEVVIKEGFFEDDRIRFYLAGGINLPLGR